MKGAPEKSKGPIQAKLSSTNPPLISWLSVWPRPGGGRAPSASESQHCIQPFRGNRVSTFPQPSWLPGGQLVRKLLQTHTDIWRVYPLGKQNLPSKACSKCKGTRLDQNRAGSRNSPLRKRTLEVNLTTCPGNIYPWNKILQTAVCCTALTTSRPTGSALI